jgi:hypothetical protein
MVGQQYLGMQHAALVCVVMGYAIPLVFDLLSRAISRRRNR